MAKKVHNKAASNADATVGYEAEHWRRADALGGRMDAAEYRSMPRSRLARRADGELLREDKTGGRYAS